MSEMTVAELMRVATEVEAQGLSVLVLAAQRLRRGKRIPPPKRVGGSLPVKAIGGRELDWYVAVEIADVQAFAKRHGADRTVPLRVVQPAEKMSREMRRMCGMDDPPADPWGDSRRAQ